jgi:adenylate cyclase, class 2
VRVVYNLAMADYTETEVKVLDIDPEALTARLTELTAKMVFDGNRTITSYDFSDKEILNKGDEVRVTEEGKIKLSYEGHANTEGGNKIVPKFIASSLSEAVAFLEMIGLVAIARIVAHRTSWEFKGVDFDLDEYPKIPAFLEVDLNGLAVSIDSILEMLGLRGKEVVTLSTQEVYARYGIDYYEEFKV